MQVFGNGPRLTRRGTVVGDGVCLSWFGNPSLTLRAPFGCKRECGDQWLWRRPCGGNVRLQAATATPNSIACFTYELNSKLN